jgi:hypothetical protein
MSPYPGLQLYTQHQQLHLHREELSENMDLGKRDNYKILLPIDMGFDYFFVNFL